MPEPALNADAVAGWFGKIPSLGDFASRRLPEDFVRTWDDWLQHGLASARNQLGTTWHDTYLVAPIRRFWLAPGVIGSACWVGVLMPSVDRVGRLFPLTIATAGAHHAHSLAAAFAAHDWFRAVDGVARQVLDMDFSVDDFERQLADLAPPDWSAAPSDASRRWAGELLRSSGPDDEGRDDEAGAATPCSVWWCGDAREEAPFLCVAALPPAASFASLLIQEG